jgi:dipeptidyl aminopeptidase/acylaminoacyl peptidase
VITLDAKTGKQLAKFAVTPPTAEITKLRVAERGGLIAVSLAAGNHTEVIVLDGKKLTAKKPVKLPFGQGNIGRFSRDGKRLAIWWSSPSSPMDLLAIDTATGVAEPLRVERRPSLGSLPNIEVLPVDIPAFDGGKIPTNVYLVQGEDRKPHPTIVSYHGGPAGVSTVRWSPTTAFFLSLGYAVVEPNVRGSIGYGRAFEMADNGRKRVDAIKDIETSARWVAEQPWADKDRLVVFGSSYGGYTVLLALTRWPELWRAGVDLYGIASLQTVLATTSGWIRSQFLLEVGDPDKDGEFLAQISPLTDIHKIVDPTFVYAGANDPRVPRSESDMIVKALRQRGVPTEYMVAENEGHSLARIENLVEFHARMARFLETHLK